jgi:hypothetical protein
MGGYAVGWGPDAAWYDAVKGGTVPRKSVLKGFKAGAYTRPHFRST